MIGVAVSEPRGGPPTGRWMFESDPARRVIRLRPLRETDLVAFRRWGQNPEVRRHYLGREDDVPVEGWIPGDGCRRSPVGTGRPAGRVVRAIESREGELLGWIELRDLNWRRRSGELRVCLGQPATWGQGIGSAAMRVFIGEAFGAWRLRSIHLRVAIWNARAVRAYEKVGFEREARLVAGRRREDGIEDLWLMTLQAERWFHRQVSDTMVR